MVGFLLLVTHFRQTEDSKKKKKKKKTVDTVATVPLKQTKWHCSNCFEKIKRLTKPKGHCKGIAFFYIVSRYFFGSPVDFFYDPRLMALD